MKQGLTVYLFETKSIQSFLERTGKLNDMILLSDTLDSLIDNTKSSSLYKVLSSTGLSSNLLVSIDDSNNTQKEGSKGLLDNYDIVFFRYKGGSLNCVGKDYNKVKAFRSAWTLFFQQAFPTMEYTDIIETGIDADDFSSSVNKVFTKLVATYNRHTPCLPIATAVCQSSAYSGLPAVRTDLQKNVSHKQDIVSVRIFDKKDESQDNISLSLYEKFSDNSREENLKLKNFFFRYSSSKTASKDIALIHLDGNSIGLTLQNIRKHLSDNKCSVDEYVDVMLYFSEKLSECTSKAAKEAIKGIKESNTCFSDNKQLLFRPLILGGDDITLFIDPCFAVIFCNKYCGEFKRLTKIALSELKDKKGIDLPAINIQYLTASGGILFNKINHPFSNSLSFISELADKAKELTKSTVDGKNKLVGDSAISFFRMSATSTEDFDSLFARSRKFKVVYNGSEKDIYTGREAYYIDSDEDKPNLNFIASKSINANIDQGGSSRLHGRFRRMMTELAHGNFEEAERIYRGITETKSIKFIEDMFGKSMGFERRNEEAAKYQWFSEKDGAIHTILDDFLVLMHYMQLKPIDTSKED